MEKRNGKEASREVAQRIGRMYGNLHGACRKYAPSFQAFDDIFQETVLYVIYDKKELCPETENLFIPYFVSRFKMILFTELKKEQKQKIAEITYASNQQAEKAEE